MKLIRNGFPIVLALVFVTAPALAKGGSWDCYADNLVSSHYDGSDRATIRLTGQKEGKTYPVRRVEGRAIGKIQENPKADRKWFVCHRVGPGI